MSQRASIREKAWLASLLGFSLAVRLLLFSEGAYPPGDDPAANAGFIYLMLKEGHIPTTNLYHMPGTPYTYPPLFHLLGSALTLLTGLQAITATEALVILVSATLILPAFCMTRLLWKSRLASAAVAFLFAVSTPDLYMLCWGGYVNVITLYMIPIVFFLSLRDRESMLGVVILGGLLSAAVLLSHHLSGFMLASLLTAIVAFGTAARGLGKARAKEWTKTVEKLAVMMAIGLFVSAPWFASKLNLYLGILTPSEMIKEAMTRTNFAYLGLQALATFTGSLTMFTLIWLAPLGFRSVTGTGRWCDPRPATFLIWIALPLILTYSFILGFTGYTQRFLYFSTHPALILTAIGLSSLPTLIAGLKDPRHKAGALIVIGLLICVYAEGAIVFIGGPNGQYNYFRTVREEEASTIEWVSAYTPQDSLIVANHSLGWWIAGVAHRPTYSATPPQLLSYSYELPLTIVANDTLYAKPDYKNALREHEVAYIALRKLSDPTPNDTADRTLIREVFWKLAGDPDLNLVFANDKIAIFRVSSVHKTRE